jgi:hypothetical protein
MSKARAMRVAWRAGIAVTGLVFAHGVANLAGGGSFDSDTDRVVYGLVQVVAALLIAAGLWLSARSRRRSVALIAAGVVAISIVMYWAMIFTIPVGLGLIALAYSRGRNRGLAADA